MVRKAVSFALIGVVNTLVDYCIFVVVHLYVGWPIIPANAVSWTIAATGSYVMNTYFTFAAESGRELRAKTYAGFLAAQVGGFVANTTTVVVLSYFVPVLIAKALAIGASFLVNFSLSNFVVFRARRGAGTPAD